MRTEAAGKARDDAMAFAPSAQPIRIWPIILFYAPPLLIGLVTGYLLRMLTS